jgi:2-polyprenyl-3-methyl-5-hydroxy-6-metoxy-1,4-benzoquinol methylase
VDLHFVTEPLRIFSFDPWAMRGKHFFEGILAYRRAILPGNRARIKPREEFRCALCKRTDGRVLLTWEAGYEVIQCVFCDFSTANFAIENPEEHVKISYDNDTYYEKFLREIVEHYDYRKNRMGKERFEYSVARLGLDQSRATILDLGCGAGWFLSYLKERGVKARGLEVNPMAVRFCESRGLDVSDSRLGDEADGTYDVITMFDVLEHLDDPIEVLATARNKLKPGGFVVGYTPNIHSIAYELMGSKQNTLLPFEHVGFFSPRSFAHLASETGFEVHTVEVFGFDIMDYLLMKEYEDGVDYTAKLREMMLLTQACIDRLGVGNHFRVTLRRSV